MAQKISFCYIKVAVHTPENGFRYVGRTQQSGRVGYSCGLSGRAFVFASVRIDISADKVMQGVLVEVAPDMEPEAEPEKETPMEDKPAPAEVRDVHNAASNATAQLDGGLKDDKGTKANDIYKDAQQLDAKLAASKAAYERMESELAALCRASPFNDQRKGNQDTERKQSRGSGNVTVEYDLEGRDAVYLPVPAYKCHNGGRVVVNITVNRSGDVISASEDKGAFFRRSVPCVRMQCRRPKVELQCRYHLSCTSERHHHLSFPVAIIAECQYHRSWIPYFRPT